MSDSPEAIRKYIAPSPRPVIVSRTRVLMRLPACNETLRPPRLLRRRSSRRGGRKVSLHAGSRMSTLVLLTITGLGLGAMYFLIASGLSLIYGLMGVLNFAHGAFLTVGAYASW